MHITIIVAKKYNTTRLHSVNMIGRSIMFLFISLFFGGVGGRREEEGHPKVFYSGGWRGLRLICGLERTPWTSILCSTT